MAFVYPNPRRDETAIDDHHGTQVSFFSRDPNSKFSIQEDHDLQLHRTRISDGLSPDVRYTPRSLLYVNY